jgi:hypothetical protein
MEAYIEKYSNKFLTTAEIIKFRKFIEKSQDLAPNCRFLVYEEEFFDDHQLGI